MINLTYIWHDCFLLESDEATVLFDYYRDGDASSPIAEPEFLTALRADKPLYIVVSHHHKDHFTRQIFGWKHIVGEVHYILSRDTEKSIRHLLRPDSMYRGVKPDSEQVTVLRPGESYSDGRLTVRAFGSTDIGNSYMVEIEGNRIFHAGDLNAWIWKDESTPAEVAAAIRDFMKVLETVRGECGERIDLAMFPVDSRIGRDYWEGAARFVRFFDVGVFVPMHFCLAGNAGQMIERVSDARSFSRYANPDRGIYVALQTPYEKLALSSVGTAE